MRPSRTIAAVCLAVTTLGDAALGPAQAAGSAPATAAGAVTARRTPTLDVHTAAGARLTARERSTVTASTWSTLWRDDFSGTSLSGAWQNCYPWKTCTNQSNGEYEWYQARNATVSGGLLHLTARRESVTRTYVPGRTRTFPYTSGLVQTSGSFAARSGRIEVRARSVAGKAIWPALWLLPVDQSWPPEIDFFEQYGNPTYFEQTVHAGSGVKDQFNHLGTDTTKAFHVYGVQWTTNLTVLTVDGRVTGVSRRSTGGKPLYLLMNQAVGGNWIGAPDASTPAYSDFQIDSVVAYGPTGANVMAHAR